MCFFCLCLCCDVFYPHHVQLMRLYIERIDALRYTLAIHSNRNSMQSNHVHRMKFSLNHMDFSFTPNAQLPYRHFVERNRFISISRFVVLPTNESRRFVLTFLSHQSISHYYHRLGWNRYDLNS